MIACEWFFFQFLIPSLIFNLKIVVFNEYFLFLFLFFAKIDESF